MALIICPECGNQISDTSEQCIHCGYKLKGTVSSSEAVQQVEVTSINLNTKKFKKMGIIIGILAILFIVGISSFMVFKNITTNNAKEHYAKDMEELYIIGLTGAGEAETMCNTIKSVWYNCIYEKQDSKTDKYTMMTEHYFYSDFNSALQNYFSDSETKNSISVIKSNQEKVKGIMKKLKDYPDNYEEYYKVCDAFYDSYKDITALAIDPNGNLKSYSDKFNEVDSDCLDKYNELKDAVSELKEEE